MELNGSLFSAISQLGFLIQFARAGGHGPIFALLCISKPAVDALFQGSLWSMRMPSLLRKLDLLFNLSLPAIVVRMTNLPYLRIRQLLTMAENQFKQDVISGNLSRYMVQGNGPHVEVEARTLIAFQSIGKLVKPSETYQLNNRKSNIIGASPLPSGFLLASLVIYLWCVLLFIALRREPNKPAYRFTTLRLLFYIALV